MAGNESDSLGMFYADGHVRVYHGELTDLPRRYVARERLCLRGTTDYWIVGASCLARALPTLYGFNCYLAPIPGSLNDRADGRHQSPNQW
jgi:hypothetical protein